MLGEDPGLEELVHAVDGKEAGHISGQVLRYRHLPVGKQQLLRTLFIDPRKFRNPFIVYRLSSVKMILLIEF
jgi:hypothetical protein